jgi:putative phage-type endonuclease
MRSNKLKIPNIYARDVATILGINPYQTAYELLEDKIEHKHPFFGNKFTEHGNRYESQAIKCFEKNIIEDIDNVAFIYSNLSNTKHPEINWLTGRLDGVMEIENEVYDDETDTKKRKRIIRKTKYVLEIKCPLKTDRTEPLTKNNVPLHYWSQCQVYMNMIDCEYGYYIEYYIKPNDIEENAKLYYVKINRDINWWNKVIPKIKLFRDELTKYYELGDLETHPVRIMENQWKSQFSDE